MKTVRKIGLKSGRQDKILEVFFEHPGKEFTVRELERMTGIPKTTVHAAIAELAKRRLIIGGRASDSLMFKTIKISHYVKEIVASGLIDYIIKELNPSCIILFGSIRKGESNKDSDIDLFIETLSQKEVNFQKFEKKLGHKVQLFVEKDIKKLPAELFNNVANGIKIYGYFDAR